MSIFSRYFSIRYVVPEVAWQLKGACTQKIENTTRCHLACAVVLGPEATWYLLAGCLQMTEMKDPLPSRVCILGVQSMPFNVTSFSMRHVVRFYTTIEDAQPPSNVTHVVKRSGS